MKTILILGGSFGGVCTAHRLLKQAPKTGNVKIILLSQTTHFFWNIASTRAIVPGQMPDDKIFRAIAPGFKQYPADRFELVIGTAEKMDVEAKKVTVATADGEEVLGYDILILATGASAKGDGPFKGRGSYEHTRDGLHEFQDKVKTATSIVVGGAGSTGVEVAGELGFEYGTQKKITLLLLDSSHNGGLSKATQISSGATILEGTPASVSKTAIKQLQTLKVAITLETKILGSAKMSDGRTELTLSDGQKITTDLYIPTVGVVPNSAYVPPNLLNSKGFVVVDDFLQVKGVKDVWAVGDISAVQRPQYVNMDKQSAHVAKNIGLLMQGRELAVYKPAEKDMMAVPIGRKAGTGHMGNMRLFSFLVVMAKGKTLFTQNLAPTVDGSMFK